MKISILIATAVLGGQLLTAADSINVTMLDGERWWGAATDLGPWMPFASDGLSLDQRFTNFNNQTTPLLVSNMGRYIWADGPMKLAISDGVISVDSHRGDVSLSQSDDHTLRGAYMAAVDGHLQPSGGVPPELFFTAPTWNTWIELMYNQNQADIMSYAHQIVDQGFEPGVLMIDDNWQHDYGVWEFRADRFPDPKAMVDSLHQMGFKVMVWVCPFVSPDSEEGRLLRKKGYLVKDSAGKKPAIIDWWNGYSACYDLSNPDAYQYLKTKLADIQQRYGIDGFKFDAGDPERYREEEISVFDGRSFDTGQTMLWARLAEEFPYNELRACWMMGNRPLVQRLGDKPYSWPAVARLVPSMIAAGLLGHPYTCPDMIGGGEFSSFLNVNPGSFAPALIVRSCQVHSMMPMMQFSVAPWRVLAPEYVDICRRYAEWHSELSPYILDMARKSAETGEPIVRHMAYEFPGQGFDDVNDQYMLGDRFLVAPIVTPSNTRTVKLPRGTWRDDTGKKIKGGRTYTLTDVPLSRLPWFERMK